MTITLEAVQKCIPVELMPRGEITATTTFESLGMDSLDFVQFLSDVEDAFHVQISNREAKAFKRLSDVQEWLTNAEVARRKVG